MGPHCSRCGPGYGVTKNCARGRDTVCGECDQGTYSPHHSSQPCWICSRCGPGLYEAHACTSKKDTVCDSCHRQAPDNPDYQRKCKHHPKFYLAPEDAKDTGEETVLVNDNDLIDALKDKEEILREDAEAALNERINFIDNKEHRV